MAEHLLVKPEKIVALAAGMLKDQLIVPNLFYKQGIEQFKGSANDTVNVKVPGTLPFRTYPWRNDRSQPIVFDEYQETTYPIKFGGHVYSAVRVTDEQYTMDLSGWGELLAPQVEAVGRGLQHRAVEHLESAPWPVTVGTAEQDPAGAVLEARRVLNQLRVPQQGRILLVGSDFETALLQTGRVVHANMAGDRRADAALTSATIGTLFGFTVVTDVTLPPSTAYAMVPNAFAFVTGAPAHPVGAKYTASVGYEGIAMRHIIDYHADYLSDRSVVSTFAGFDHIKDVITSWDKAKGQEIVHEPTFLRGIKLHLSDASVYPGATSVVGKATNVGTGWTPRTSGTAESSTADSGTAG